jgi:hypothetical protein
MDELKTDPEKDKRAYILEALIKATEYANKIGTGEPLLVIPKEWGYVEKEV